MSSLSRRACFKCGNVGHYAGKLHAHTGFGMRCRETCAEASRREPVLLTAAYSMGTGKCD